MFSLSLLSLVLTAAQPAWQSDYAKAYKDAKTQKKDLFIYFRNDEGYDGIFQDEEVQQQLKKYVCLQLPTDYVYKGELLLDHPALEDMLRSPGILIVSMHNDQLEQYQEVVSAHPFVRSRYGWVPNYGVEEVKVILDLPPEATLTQRSMIYAVRVHPERPQSVYANPHAAFRSHARWHSRRQANARNQHHADIIAATHWLHGEVGDPSMGYASEVVAESWGNFVGGENVLEASFSCIDAWRHSSGHWGAVSRGHRFFGYDIAKSDNGTWYATGIFAD